MISAAERHKPKKQILNNVNIFRVGFTRSYSRTDRLSRILFIFFSISKGLSIKFDLIEGTGFWGFLPAYILGFVKRSLKTIFVPDTIENYAVGIDIFSKYLLKLTEKIIITGNWNKIICISREVQKKVIKLGSNKNRTAVIYCGADIRNISKIKSKRPETVTITCVSRLVPYKNIPDLIKAVAILKISFPEIRLNIIGEGEDFGYLKKLSAQLKISNAVRFYGFIPKHRDVLKIISNSTLFCLPSSVEGFGIATVEALASGVPAILPNIPVHREINKGKGVVFYGLNNYQDLAEKVNLILRDKSLYSKLQRAALKIVKSYDWSEIARQTQKTYENLRID